MAGWQRHHFGEAGRDAVDFVNESLGCHNVLITLNLDRSSIDAREALASALPGLQGEGTALHFIPADVHMDRCRRVADIGKPQLCVQAGVVVPGQPVGRVELAGRQRHDLREAGVGAADLVDQPRCGDDILIADNLYRSIVDAGEALLQAFACQQCERTTVHLIPADVYVHGCRGIADIRKAQLCIQPGVVVPGQPVGSI